MHKWDLVLSLVLSAGLEKADAPGGQLVNRLVVAARPNSGQTFLWIDFLTGRSAETIPFAETLHSRLVKRCVGPQDSVLARFR
jgi:hypothetical protein